MLSTKPASCLANCARFISALVNSKLLIQLSFSDCGVQGKNWHTRLGMSNLAPEEEICFNGVHRRQTHRHGRPQIHPRYASRHQHYRATRQHCHASHPHHHASRHASHPSPSRRKIPAETASNNTRHNTDNNKVPSKNSNRSPVAPFQRTAPPAARKVHNHPVRPVAPASRAPARWPL